MDLPFIRQLVGVARSAGYTVERNDAEVPALGGGACIYDQRRICISSRFGEMEALPVVIHEVAHALIHEAPGRDDDERMAHEEEANWVRTSVLAALGLLELLPPEKVISGPAPTDDAAEVAKVIIAAMPKHVIHYRSRLGRQPMRQYEYPASDESVRRALIDSALLLGLEVVWVSGRPGVAGEHRAGAQTITISNELPGPTQVAVLAHELVHALQHPPGDDYPAPSTEERDQVERVAHAAAADALRRFGLVDYADRLGAIGVAVGVAVVGADLEEARMIANIIERSGTMYPRVERLA